MPTPGLPFATGLVMGKFAEDIIDEQTGGHLSGAPLQNVTVKFTPNIEPNFVQNIYGTPKTYVIEPVYAVTNADGDLVIADHHIPINELEPGVELIASIDENINPSGWTWTAELNAPDLPTMTIDFTVSADQEIDLSRVTPIPPDLNGDLANWQIAVAAASEAVDEAIEQAQKSAASAVAAAQSAAASATSAVNANAAKISAQFASSTAEIHEHNAQTAAANAQDAREDIQDLSVVIDDSIGNGYKRLEEHRVSHAPHPEYDDMANFKLLFENKLI